MRANRFFVVVILSVFVLAAHFILAADDSAVLNQIQELIRQKDFSTAKGLLAQRLKADRNSYKLWLALGYVYEADSDYEQAIKAFMRASELQTGIKGLATRISRLQELIKSQPKKVADSDNAQIEARNLLINARYKYSFKDYLEAYQLFIQAVELDRSILARDYGFINNGLKYFNENANQPEIQFYLGAYNFYAGLYPKADVMLSDYIREFPDGKHAGLAKNLLQECRDIVAQTKAAKAAEAMALAAAEAEKNGNSQIKTIGSDTASITAHSVSNRPITDTEEPEFDAHQVYDSSSTDEPLEIIEARARVSKLLNEFDRETNDQAKYRILWRIGVIQQPFPEVMAKFSSLLNRGSSIETIYATLEALEKIGKPGAEACVASLYRLLGHDDIRVSYRAIQSFGRMPMQAEKVIPRIFSIYQNEKYEIRKNLIVRTFQAYGTDGIAVFDAMIKAAVGPNKRPIAEVISILTGNDVEEIIRNS